MPLYMKDSSPDSIFDLETAEFEKIVLGWGWPAFRGRQVCQWVYGKLVTDPARMTNLSKSDRELLAQRIRFETGKVIREQTSEDGTLKILVSWGLEQNAKGVRNAEAVMIPDDDRRTACLSSQVGCPAGCKFCASGVN